MITQVFRQDKEAYHPDGHAVNETFIRQQADRLISSGLFGAGYDTVIVDGKEACLLELQSVSRILYPLYDLRISKNGSFFH